MAQITRISTSPINVNTNTRHPIGPPIMFQYLTERKKNEPIIQRLILEIIEQFNKLNLAKEYFQEQNADVNANLIQAFFNDIQEDITQINIVLDRVETYKDPQTEEEALTFTQGYAIHVACLQSTIAKLIHLSKIIMDFCNDYGFFFGF